MNLFFEWRKQEEKDGNTREHYLNIPVKVVKGVDDGFGFKSNLICNQCEGNVNQVYICNICGDKNSIGNITKRKIKSYQDGQEIDVVYEEAMKKTYLETVKPKNIIVVEEIDAERIISEVLRVKSVFEVYNNDKNISLIIGKIHSYLIRNKKALIVNYCGSGGIIVAGNGELLLYGLRDGRLIRKPKQEGIGFIVEDEVSLTLNTISEDDTPEKMEQFIDLIRKGEKIDVSVIEPKPLIMVETSWLE